MATKSGASWVPAAITVTTGGGAESEPTTSIGNENLIRGYWLQILPQLGYTGPLTEKVTTAKGTVDEQTDEVVSQQALQAIRQFEQQGYELVRNPQRTDSGSKSITEYGFRLPSGELANTWEYKGGAWYEQIAPYIGLVLPAVLGIAGTKLGVAGTGAGGAVTVGDVAQSIGANITGQTGNALLNNAVGGAVIGGAKELITSGGDPEQAIKGALTGGALAGAASLAQPYIEKAANALSDLTGDEVAQLAGTDVAGDLGGVEVGGAEQAYVNPLEGGAGFDYATAGGNVVLNQMSPAAQEVYVEALRQGATESTALLRAMSFEDLLLNEGLSTAAVDTSMNALAGGGVAAGAAGAVGAGAATGATGAANALTGGGVVSTQIPPTGQVATVDLTSGQGVYDPYTGLAENFPVTDAGTAAGATDFGVAAGVAGAGAAAGAAGAGAAGAGGVMTETDLAGLDPNLTIGAGTDVLGGTDATGAAIGAGAATGAITAGGAAATPTGIPMVDDFLNYLGTPAGALALSAFGSLAGGYFQGQAAKEAAQTQATAAQNALALQREMFDYQKSLLEPYQKAGTAALGRLTGAMGLGGEGSPQQMLEMDPGYAFRLGEGMKALERVQAARGNMLSGGAIKAGQRYAQDVASQEYGNAYNRLSNIAGLGQTAGTQLGAAGQQFGQTAGSAMGDVANSLAAGRVGRTSAYTQGFGGAANAYTDYFNRQQQNQLFRDIYGRTIGG